MVKLLMTWNIQDGKEQEYLEYVTQDFGTALMRNGLMISDAWINQVGDGPQITVGAIAEDELELRVFLDSEEWRQLRSKLTEYVEDFRARITDPLPGGFQLF